MKIFATLVLAFGVLQSAAFASQYQPHDLIIDMYGDIYIADVSTSSIVKINRNSGQQINVAGNGIAGFSGDNGPATDARLYVPAGITLDEAGNLYIADAGNSRIRKVDVASGIITTVAGNGSFGYGGDGGLALNANLNIPYDVVHDRQNNLYIADSNNHRIRKLNLSTGIITTVAGNGSAGFSGDGGLAINASLNWPDGIAIDELGNLYISDALNYRIRKVEAATGLIYSLNEAETEERSQELDLGMEAAQQLSYNSESPMSENSTEISAAEQQAVESTQRLYTSSNSLNSRTRQMGVTGDVTPPNSELLIDNGSERTNSHTLSLSLICEDDSSGCSHYRLSEDGNNWQEWTSYQQQVSWTINGEDGLKSLYVEYKDMAGNSSAIASAEIVLDTEAPAEPLILSPSEGWSGDKQAVSIRGQAEAYSTVELYSGLALIGLVSADADGEWQLELSFDEAAEQYLTAIAIDVAGNSSPTSEITLINTTEAN